MRTLKRGTEQRGNVRWAFAEAQRLVGCDLCEVEAGEPCINADEEALGTVHIQRLHSYHDEIGEDCYVKRHTTPTPGRTK